MSPTRKCRPTCRHLRSQSRSGANPPAANVETLEPRHFLSAASVAVNANTVYQTMVGFGAGMTTDFNRKEYFDPKFFDTIVNDLGTTIARAGINPAFENSHDNNDPNTFDFSRFNSAALAQPMSFFQKLQERGVNNFVATMWTAPWWM